MEKKSRFIPVSKADVVAATCVRLQQTLLQALDEKDVLHAVTQISPTNFKDALKGLRRPQVELIAQLLFYCLRVRLGFVEEDFPCPALHGGAGNLDSQEKAPASASPLLSDSVWQRILHVAEDSTQNEGGESESSSLRNGIDSARVQKDGTGKQLESSASEKCDKRCTDTNSHVSPHFLEEIECHREEWIQKHQDAAIEGWFIPLRQQPRSQSGSRNGSRSGSPLPSPRVPSPRVDPLAVSERLYRAQTRKPSPSPESRRRRSSPLPSPRDSYAIQLQENKYKPPAGFKYDKPQPIPEDENGLSESSPSESQVHGLSTSSSALSKPQASERLIDPDRLLKDIRKGLEEFKKREALSSLIGSHRLQQSLQPTQTPQSVAYAQPNGWCTPPTSDRRQRTRSHTPSPCRATVQQRPDDNQRTSQHIQSCKSGEYMKYSGCCTSPVSSDLQSVKGQTKLPREDMVDVEQGSLGCDQGSCSVDPFNSPPRPAGGRQENCTGASNMQQQDAAGVGCDDVSGSLTPPGMGICGRGSVTPPGIGISQAGKATPSRATPASRAGTSFFAITPSNSDGLSLDVPTDLGDLGSDLSSIPSALDLSQALGSEVQSELGEGDKTISAEIRGFGGKNPFYATAARVCRGFDMSQFQGAPVL